MSKPLSRLTSIFCPSLSCICNMSCSVMEILYTEYIKPSSPTPPHLKIHKLSSLDQTLQPHYYLPVYFFFQNRSNINPIKNLETLRQERCRRLKTSLSHLLTLYYPFAGKIRDQTSVFCDDHGVPFTHAVTDATISSFLQNLDLHRLPQLLPDQAERRSTDMVKVQVTDFSCGGLVLGILVSHAVSDGISVSVFVRSWATLCLRQDYTSSVVTTQLRPDFSGGLHFPAANFVPAKAMMVPHVPPFVKQGKLRVRRLVFGRAGIGALRKKAASRSVPRPSKAEVVSGLLSKCIISALDARSRSKTGATVSHMVNLRQRAEPPFPLTSTGNYVWPTMVLQKAGDEKANDLSSLVSEVREATAKIDGRLVELLRGRGSSEKIFRELEKVHNGASAEREFIQFTNCCNFKAYENDFGWGKPTWVCMIGPPAAECSVFMNLVVLTDTTTGDGIEALVFLDEQDMAFLECSQVLQTYAEFDQDPFLLTNNNTGTNADISLLPVFAKL